MGTCGTRDLQAREGVGEASTVWCPQLASPGLSLSQRLAEHIAQPWLSSPACVPAAPTGAFPGLSFPEEGPQVSGTWKSQASKLFYAPRTLQGGHALLPTASASTLVFNFM